MTQGTKYRSGGSADLAEVTTANSSHLNLLRDLEFSRRLGDEALRNDVRYQSASLFVD